LATSVLEAAPTFRHTFQPTSSGKLNTARVSTYDTTTPMKAKGTYYVDVMRTEGQKLLFAV
jgi:hypothetical protein